MHNNRRSRRNILLYLLLLPLLGIIIGCTADRGSKTPQESTTETDITIGMSLSNFKRIFPDASVSPEGQWHRPVVFYGLPGEWVFTFRDGRLAWYVFNARENEVTSDNFDRYLAAARKAIEAYSDRFGEPAERQEGISHFQDPEKTLHRGYRVLEARWNERHGRLKISFDFMGESLPYRFFLTVEART